MSSASPPRLDHSQRQRSPSSTPKSMSVTRYCGAERKLTTDLTALMRGIWVLDLPFALCLTPHPDGPSYRSRDPAVFPDAPEVHGHQERGDQRNPDAVEDVEAQQRAGADEPSAEQAEARVVGRGDELDVADLQQARARPLD